MSAKERLALRRTLKLCQRFLVKRLRKTCGEEAIKLGETLYRIDRVLNWQRCSPCTEAGRCPGCDQRERCDDDCFLCKTVGDRT